MACVNYKRLIEGFRRAPQEAKAGLKACIAPGGEYRARDFELGKLFSECFGHETYLDCKHHGGSVVEHMQRRLAEAEGAVATHSFLNITGQIVYAAVLEKYQAEEFVFAKMIPEVTPTTLQGEKMAGITDLGDVSVARPEGEPYQLAGVGEDWIFTPPVLDYGRIVAVTWEAVFEDKTGQLMDSCAAVGEWIGFGEEKSAINCVIDENVTTHRYNWRGTTIASYNDNTGTHTWDNLAASNALVDWTDVDNAEQLLNGITNPYTGTPIMMEAKHLIVYKGLEQTARRIVNATEIRVATPGYATSGNPTLTNMVNPYQNKYQVVTSRLLAQQLATDTSWFLGDISKYAKRMVAEPLQVVTRTTNTEDEFSRRVVAQYRANKRYAHVCVQPRALIKSTA